MIPAPGSIAGSMTFKQSDGTPSHITWLFHAVNTADSTDATGKTFVQTISKNGAAFASPNAGTAVTEIANGWYKVVHNVADVDTLGALACRLTSAGVDTVNAIHTVVVQDPYAANATTILKDGSLTAAKFSSDGLAANKGVISVKGPTLVATLSAGLTSFARSMKAAIDTTVVLAGTFGGSTVRIETTNDETAASPVWTDQSAGGLTAGGQVVLTGPFSAWRARVSAGTATSVTVKATDRFAGAQA